MNKTTIQEVVEQIGEIQDTLDIFQSQLDSKMTCLVGLFRGKRKSAGVTLRGAARKLRVSSAYLSDVELRRRNISEDNFDRFVDYFDNL